MTNYTFVPNAQSQFVNWADPSIWAGKVVPDSADADVDFPTVTFSGSGSVYTSYVEISSGDSFSVRSIELRDYLLISGSLRVSGALVQHEFGEIDMKGGTLVAGSITNNAYDIQGVGSVTVGELVNNQLIVGGSVGSGTLSVTATSLINNGTLAASMGSLILTVAPGGLAGGTAGTLNGGAYWAMPSGTLSLNIGTLVSVDNAAIKLSGGTITSRDPVTGNDVPLTTSLTTIAHEGSLTIEGDYAFGALDVAGKIILGGTSNFTSTDIDLTAEGSLQGKGTVHSPIHNDGTITAEAGGLLVLQGAVDGDGQLVVAAEHRVWLRPSSYQSLVASLELTGTVDQKVVFGSDRGVLQLDTPASFTGTLITKGSGDQILLKGIGLSSVTDVSYTRDALGGTLTLQQGSASTVLHFGGKHTIADFALANVPGILSSDPSSLRITISQTASAFDFNGDQHSDILWRNANGAVTVWGVTGDVHADQLHLGLFNAAAGLDWKIQDVADFDGDGRADMLWRNTNGEVQIWKSVSSGFQMGAFSSSSAGNEWQIAATGDFNGDGRDDILWRHQNGGLSEWTSTSASFGLGIYFNQNAYDRVPIGTDWHVLGAADFNADRRDDILWRNDDGTVNLWTSNGTGFAEGVFQAGVGRDWHVAGLGDLDGDGRADILWRNDNGAVTAWLSIGTGFEQNQFNAGASTDWKIAALGDYNGDGRDDVLWRNDNGSVTMWQSNGHGFDMGIINTGTTTDWSIVGHDGFF
jgi:hypothetical protein